MRFGIPAGSLDRPILRLAIPGLLASVSVPLIGIADTAMIGHLPEVALLGAVATASVLFDVLFWGAGFLRMGTTSIVSQHHGAGDRRGSAAALFRALLLAAVIGLLILTIRGPAAEIGFALVGGSEQVQLWGRQYFDIRVLGVPLVLGTMVLNGFFLGSANAWAPLVVTVVTNLVNIVADYALIFGHWGAPELGVIGAAWASVAAAATGFALGVSVLLAFYRATVFSSRPKALFDPGRLRHMLSTNLNLCGRTLCLLAAQFLLVALVARMGEVPLAAHAVVWQLWSLVSYGVDGFAHAAEALVGNRLGAGDRLAARHYARRILLWGAAIGLLFSGIYAVGLERIAGWFTPHAEVVAAVASLTVLVAVVQPLNALVFVLDGIFIGANDSAYLFRAMALAAFAGFAPAAILLVIVLEGGLVAAWGAYIVLMLGRFLPLARRYRGSAWQRTFLSTSTGV